MNRAHSRQAASEDGWVGTYKSDDKNSAISGDFTITIKRSDDKLTATVYAEGTQLYENFECSTKITENVISLYFARNLGDSIAYSAGHPIKPGQIIGSLVSIRNRNGNKYLYKPGVFEIGFDSRRKLPSTVYFFKRK